MRVLSLGGEESLEKEGATHSSILAWRIPWTEEPGGLWSIGLQSVRHNQSNLARTVDSEVNSLRGLFEIVESLEGLSSFFVCLFFNFIYLPALGLVAACQI